MSLRTFLRTVSLERDPEARLGVGGASQGEVRGWQQQLGEEVKLRRGGKKGPPADGEGDLRGGFFPF